MYKKNKNQSEACNDTDVSNTWHNKKYFTEYRVSSNIKIKHSLREYYNLS